MVLQACLVRQLPNRLLQEELQPLAAARGTQGTLFYQSQRLGVVVRLSAKLRLGLDSEFHCSDSSNHYHSNNNRAQDSALSLRPLRIKRNKRMASVFLSFYHLTKDMSIKLRTELIHQPGQTVNWVSHPDSGRISVNLSLGSGS